MHKFSRFKPKTKRGKIVGALTGFLVSIGIGVGVAALFFGHAPITGDVTSNPFDVTWTSAATPAPDGMTCTDSVVGGKLDVHISHAYPGASCSLGGFIQTSASSEAGVVSGLDLTLPDGWTSSLNPGICGLTLPPGTPKPVGITITMGGTAVAGSSGAFAVDDGIKVAPASESAPLDCTP